MSYCKICESCGEDTCCYSFKEVEDRLRKCNIFINIENCLDIKKNDVDIV